MRRWGEPLLESEGAALPEGVGRFLKFRQTRWRFLALFVTSFYLCGSYYAFDFPAAARGEILEWMNINSESFATIMACYSLPNVILPIFGGVLVDNIGIRRSLVLFATLNLIGQGLFSVGLRRRQFYFVCFGRFVFGLGGECLNVANSALTTHWFKGKELAFALGVSLTVSRIGSVGAFNVSPILFADGLDLPAVSWAATAMTLFSLVSAVGAALLDLYADSYDLRYGPETRKMQRHHSGINISKVMRFPKMYWLITCSCVLLYIGFYPFTQVVSSGLLELRGGLDIAAANFYTSVPTMVSAGMSPIFGGFVDRIGCRPCLVLISTLLTIAVHLTFFLCELVSAPMSLYLIRTQYITLGFAISIYAAVIWPMIPLTVDSHSIGLAFGLTTALQNIGLALAPLVLGSLIDEGNGSYLMAESFLLICVTLALLVAGAIWVVDMTTGGIMSMPAPSEQICDAAAYGSPNSQATPTHFVDLPLSWRHLLRSPIANSNYREGTMQRLGLTH
eukprot:GEMP01009040.1.p1 GENE.GEMP01009040.1~~GEMP01009040.1.p1  ORF type:complete len:515 (+),score=90.33 GEMP01009040.1:30-1547(+)